MKRPVLPLALAAILPAALAAQSPHIAYTEETLPNGLKVVYAEDHATPVVAVDIWYNVGSKVEQPGRTGFAHLFEHMMFKGSRNVPDGQHFALLEGAGARAGNDINGTTSWDRTNYFEQLPSNQLELALWLEADRMGTLADVLTQQKLDNQREVVKNERRQSVDNQPYGSWLEKMLAYSFPEGHPYHHSVIGSMEDLSAANLEDVRSFFRTWYAPNNAVLVVAGDFDPAQAKALVRKHFAAIPRQAPPPPLRDASLPATIGHEQHEVVQDANAPVPAVYAGYRVPSRRDAHGAAVELLAGMLSGRSSPLYEALVRRQQAATTVNVFQLGLVDGGDLIVVRAGGRPGSNPDSLDAAVRRELDNVMAGLTQENLDRARAQARYDLVNGLQTTGGFGGRADELAMGWTFFHDPGWVNRHMAELDRVTLADVQALARERLVPANRVTLVYVPNRAPAGAATPGSR